MRSITLQTEDKKVDNEEENTKQKIKKIGEKGDLSHRHTKELKNTKTQKRTSNNKGNNMNR